MANREISISCMPNEIPPQQKAIFGRKLVELKRDTNQKI